MQRVEVRQLGAGVVFLPVAIEPLQAEVVVLDPFHKLEGSRAHGVQRVVLAPLLHRGWRNDPARAVAEAAGQGRVRVLQDQPHGQWVDDLGPQDIHQLAAIEGGFSGILLAIDAEFHGVGVEVRAVVKLDVFAELENVGLGVRDIPRLDELAGDLAFHVDREERVVQRAGVLPYRADAGLVDVELARLAPNADHHAPAANRRTGHGGRGSGRRGGGCPTS